VSDDPETWWQDKTQRAQALIDDIKVLAERARARGFQTTEYILNTAIAELLKEIEADTKNQTEFPKPTGRDEGAPPQITKPDKT
jgi:hypothetical protein